MLQGALELVSGQPLPGTRIQLRYIDASTFIQFFMLKRGHIQVLIYMRVWIRSNRKFPKGSLSAELRD